MDGVDDAASYFQAGGYQGGVILTATAVPGVKVIRITSAITDPLESYIQVAEVVAIEAGTGIDVALASEGAMAVAASSYEGWAVAANAIDGDYPCPFLQSYCSATPQTHEFLEITLAKPCNLVSVSVYGRVDCGYRDIYNVTLLDASGIPLIAGRVDATHVWGGSGTLEVPSAGLPTAEPEREPEPEPEPEPEREPEPGPELVAAAAALSEHPGSAVERPAAKPFEPFDFDDVPAKMEPPIKPAPAPRPLVAGPAFPPPPEPKTFGARLARFLGLSDPDQP